MEKKKNLEKIADDDLRKLAREFCSPLYVVGGRVRDALCNLPIGEDADICAAVGADEFIKGAAICGFKVVAVYPAMGSVKIKKGKNSYEFTSFRTDEYLRGHRPDKTYAATDINEDARRRDFKCDAIYYDISAGELVDPLGGLRDMERKVVSATRDAEEVFSADGLRLMRLARICAHAGFSPDEECLSAAKAHAKLILDIAPERIWSELEKILAVSGCKGLEILRETGVLDLALYRERQDLYSLSLCEKTEGEEKFGALVLDTKGADISANLSKKEAAELAAATRVACERLKVQKRLTQKSERLVRMLSGPGEEDMLFFINNRDVLESYLKLLEAGCNPNAKIYRARLDATAAAGRPMSLKELAVTGEDMVELGFSGADIGKTLKRLLNEAADGCVENSKKCLLNLAASMRG